MFYHGSKLLKNYLFVLLALLIVSCQGYEKLLKSNDYRKKYAEAKRYYEEEDYLRAATLFDQCAPVFRGAKEADTVFFYRAMTYYHQNDFILAAHYFQNFSNTFGTSGFKQEADYMVAYCYYLQSPRPSLDQSVTRQAIQAYQLYLINYPDSEHSDKARETIAELKDKLVEKSFISAKLYFDMEDYKAALVALNNALVEYPNSKYREEIMFMILKSSYLLAINSVESKKRERFQAAIDEYYSYITEFPETVNEKEAKRIYELSSKKVALN